uniref:Uncharacterized protein n=1 Tax=Populus trichocarpa TaxID=3694 RepID=A0A2K1Y849_POPTR
MENSEPGGSMEVVLKRIESAMDKCRKEKKNSDSRDFMLLVAQVRVMEEMSYLCQGIICTLLRNKDEAEKRSEQFEKLVPKNHLKKTPEVTKSGNVWVTNCFLQSLSILNP